MLYYLAALNNTVNEMPTFASVMLFTFERDDMIYENYVIVTYNEEVLVFNTCWNPTRCTMDEFSHYVSSRVAIHSTEDLL